VRIRRLFILCVAIAVLAVAGCAKEAEEPTVEPKIAPPVIADAGVLRAGVDLSYPPFAGVDSGVEAGLDVDIAAAIAERLGLTLQLVDVGADGAAAIEADDVDIALGALPITEAVLANVTFAGSYLVDGAASFSYEESSTGDVDGGITVLSSQKVGAQRGSAGYWQLESEYGEGFTVAYDTLREAFDALVAGEVDVVIGDAAVGAYLARDYQGVVYTGQFGPGTPVGVALAKDATELEEVIRETLDALVAEGVLDTIKTKWLGSLPSLSTTSTGG